MLYPLTEMHVIASVPMLLWSPHGHGGLVVCELCNAIGDCLAWCLLQRSACSWWNGGLLRWEIAVFRLLAEEAPYWRCVGRVWGGRISFGIDGLDC